MKKFEHSNLVGRTIVAEEYDDTFTFLLLDNGKRVRFDKIDYELGLYQDEISP